MLPLCTTHQWRVLRAEPEQELHPRTGWPTGFSLVHEATYCPACTSHGMRRVPGCRARSPQAAMAMYRKSRAKGTA